MGFQGVTNSRRGGHEGGRGAKAALSLNDLPPPDTRRWVASRKSMVVQAVEQGVLTAEEACARYEISAEEFEIWAEAITRHGEKGLKVTAIQRLRDL